jgi:LPXTG-motif cell wall-anchored protein
MLRKIRSRRIIASVIVLLMLFATTGLAMADTDVSVGGPIDFVVIKQATVALIWVNFDISDDDIDDFINYVKSLDSSLKNGVKHGIKVTSDSSAMFSTYFSGSQYVGSGFSVSGDTLTIKGDYSHYFTGNYGGDDPDDPETYEVEVTKTVTGVEDQVDRTFTFSFYYNDPSESDGDETPIEEDPLSITVTGSDSETQTQVLTIPASMFENGKITIYVEENEIAPDDWTYDSIKPMIVDDEGGSVTFVNSYNPDDPDPKYQLTVTKEWKDSDDEVIPQAVSFNALTTYPAVTIELYKDGEPMTPAKSIELSDENSWTYTFTDLDPGDYSVKELTVPGYTVTYSHEEITLGEGNDGDSTITVTNTKRGDEPDPDEPELTITKSVTPASRVGSSGTFTYTLVVRYNGEGMLYDAEVKDVFSGPAGATYDYGNITFNPNEEGYSFHEESGIFNLGDMEDGDVITITYTVDITGLGTHNNTATVSGTLESQEPMSDEDDASVQLRRPDRDRDRDDDPDDPVDIPEEPTPEGPAPEDDSTVEIVEEEVPLSPVPKTGVEDNIALMALLMLASLAGIGVVTRRKSLER